MTKKSNPWIYPLLLLTILVTAGYFRLAGINWDRNQHLHPDERFITMVTMAMQWPASFKEYLATPVSTLNPHNLGFDFYVYGTWPLLVVKAVAEAAGRATYDGITVAGRAVSAVMDLVTLAGVYGMTRLITKRKAAALWAALLYACMVVPIQLAHFYATDTFLVTFLVISFFCLAQLYHQPRSRAVWGWAIALGISYGLAVAAKVSGMLFAPVLGLGVLYWGVWTKAWGKMVTAGALMAILGLLTLRLALPYLFADASLLAGLNQKTVQNWKTLKLYDDPTPIFPPATQWIPTQKIIFPLTQTVTWGLGLPITGLILLAGYFLVRKYKSWSWLMGLAGLWCVGLVVYQGSQFAKPLRYLYPMYPFLALLFGAGIVHVTAGKRRPWVWALITGLCLLWPVAFSRVHNQEHPRITASKWMYAHLPTTAGLTCDYWDDCLPLPLQGRAPQEYPITELHLYDLPDNTAKWQDLTTRLAGSEYIVLTSNRLYASISSVPLKHPIGSRFYQMLFAEELGFTKVAEFTNRPGFAVPGIKTCLTLPWSRYGWVARPRQACDQTGMYVVDDYAEESFTVYDHPKVTIFQNSQRYPAEQLLGIITHAATAAN